MNQSEEIITRQWQPLQVGPVTKILAVLYVVLFIALQISPMPIIQWLCQYNNTVFSEWRCWTLLTSTLLPFSICNLFSALVFDFFQIRLVENTLKRSFFLFLLGAATLTGSLTVYLLNPSSSSPQILLSLPGMSAAGAALHLFRRESFNVFTFSLRAELCFAIVILPTLLFLAVNGWFGLLSGNLAALGAGYLLIRIQDWRENHRSAPSPSPNNNSHKIELD